MFGSVAQGPIDASQPGESAGRAPGGARRATVLAGLAIAAAALVVYVVPQPPRVYDHFVWQALAFLDGRAAIDYPVGPGVGTPGNWFFQDVMPVRDAAGQLTGRALIPFPPLPAVVLLPFVAIWGAATDAQRVAGILGAFDVLAAFWALGGLRIGRAGRVAATVFLAFGTVLWYAAFIGTTWYFAHVVAVGLAMLAVGLALRGDRDAADEAAADAELEFELDGGAAREFEFDGAFDQDGEPDRAEGSSSLLRDLAADIADVLASPLAAISGRQFLAGLLFGLAATARLPVIFGAPFFVLVGSGETWARRAWSAGLGALIPIALLLGYNVASTGQLVHPAYEYQYRLEALGYPDLGYHPSWAIEDPRYLPQNLGILLFAGPAILPNAEPVGFGDGAALCTSPDARRGLFDPRCPIAMPRDIGLSVLLTSPAYLLAIPALRRWGRSRLVTGAGLAILPIAILNLMHFSQGWVQFGYRFSNDVVAFALPLVGIGLAAVSGRTRGVVVAGLLIGLSLVVNLWGVIWGAVLGW